MNHQIHDISDIDYVFITYNYHPNSIESSGENGMSSTTEYEQIRKKKEELLSELQSLEQKGKALGTNVRVLEEKLSIRMLEERVEAQRSALKRLENRKKDLEQRLKEPLSKPEPPHPQLPKPGVLIKAEEPKEDHMPTKPAMAQASDQQPKQSAPPASNQQPKKQESKEKREKKKRKWF